MADFAPIPGYSRSGIDRAGTALQNWWTDKDAETTDGIVHAFTAMIVFRESFQLPLKKTVMGFDQWFAASGRISRRAALHTGRSAAQAPGADHQQARALSRLEALEHG
jgi:hypothetical protein